MLISGVLGHILGVFATILPPPHPVSRKRLTGNFSAAMRSKRYPDKPRIGIRARVKFLWVGRVLLGKVTGMCEGGYLVSPVRQRVQMLVKASRVVLSTEGTPLSWIIAQ